MKIEIWRRPQWVFDGANTSEEISFRKLAFGKGCNKELFIKKLESIKQRFKKGNI